MKTKIIAVANQKGGVGKSTLAFHLSHAAAGLGKNARVLCLDLDSQGNFSQYLTGDLDIIKDTEKGVGLLLEGQPFEPTKTTHPQISLLHGHEKLDRYDSIEEVDDRVFGLELVENLRNLGYDYVIIDTPPAVGLRHLAALYWADTVLIPMEPVMSGIIGFQNVLQVINDAIVPLNPKIKWFGVMNRANMRVNSQREKDKWMRDTYGKKILATLGTRTSVSDAMEESPARPVWARKGAPKDLREQWLNFCTEVIRK